VGPKKSALATPGFTRQAVGIRLGRGFLNHRRRGPWGAAEQPDGGLAMDPRDRHDLIQQLPLLCARRLPVALPLHRGVLPKAGSCHGLLLCAVGNRDF
jgi:hypothetical protein